MIITCPHCHTRYQVASDMIGSAGRKVQCAHCHGDWRAIPEPESPPTPDDRLFSALEEEKLDDAFIEAERAAAGETASKRGGGAASPAPAAAEPPAKPAAHGPHRLLKAPLKRLARRERSLLRQMPRARLRRTVRLAGAAALVLLLAGLYGLRTDLVRAFPSLAGLYAAAGLPVNVVGLAFRDVKTLKTLANGMDRLVIDARIVSVAPRPVSVPPVVVTLIDAAGRPIYEWSAVGPAGAVGPGEAVPFETQLPAPPPAAVKVVLTFGPDNESRARAAKPLQGEN